MGPSDRSYYVYIMSNQAQRFYIGFTNDLVRRIYEHKSKSIEGFTKRYNLTKLVYYEQGLDPASVIAREKELKGWGRDKKGALITSMNPLFNDLSAGWYDDDGER